jgi:AraC family transcriptional regulator, regulatory protein of adaptative response / methylated-DNA-[protein]-cysteine methyltransferase
MHASTSLRHPRDAQEGGTTAGAVKLIKYDFGQTTVGFILVATGDNGIVAIAIREHDDPDALVSDLRARFPHATLQHAPEAIRPSLEAVVRFVEDPHADLALPLDIRGTAFQRRVWAAVQRIPFATTTTFAEIARQAGSPNAVRAVGNACSQNPLEFAIPCHRVLRSDGSFSGGSPWGDYRQSTIVGREAARAASRGTGRETTRERTP